MKISMHFETIHTILQVQNLVIVLLSFLVIYAGQIAKTYYSVPQVSEAEPEFLPHIFIYTGIAMIIVAYLGFFASKSESKMGLLAYIIFCAILLANFSVFTFLLKYGS
jgi:Tetraspanin family